MAAGDHDCVDLARHAHLAVILILLVLLWNQHWLLATHHLGRIYHTVVASDRRQETLRLLVLHLLLLHHLSLLSAAS